MNRSGTVENATLFHLYRAISAKFQTRQGLTPMANYWLLKSEPTTYSIDDLMRRPRKSDSWDGVRNYQARNFLRDEFRIGDLAFFYHSSCAEPGIVGIVKVVGSAYPDRSAFDPDDHHFDPRSTPSNPRWYAVDIAFVSKLAQTLTLDQLRQYAELSAMKVLQKGNRLSVTPVTAAEWQFIDALLRRSRPSDQRKR